MTEFYHHSISHRTLVAILGTKLRTKQREERTAPPIIKWWGLREKNQEVFSFTQFLTTTNVEDRGTKLKTWWTNRSIQLSRGHRIWQAIYHLALIWRCPNKGPWKKNHSTISFSAIKSWRINKFTRMPIGKQRKRLLSPDRSIIKIFTIKGTLEMAREICIDLRRAHPNAHNISKASAKSWYPILRLRELFNCIIEERRTPSHWQESGTNIEKGK